jgi:hypothetical protein
MGRTKQTASSPGSENTESAEAENLGEMPHTPENHQQPARAPKLMFKIINIMCIQNFILVLFTLMLLLMIPTTVVSDTHLFCANPWYLPAGPSPS